MQPAAPIPEFDAVVFNLEWEVGEDLIVDET